MCTYKFIHRDPIINNTEYILAREDVKSNIRRGASKSRPKASTKILGLKKDFSQKNYWSKRFGQKIFMVTLIIE